jgi:hypothetical protein
MQKRESVIKLQELPPRVSQLNYEDLDRIFGGCLDSIEQCYPEDTGKYRQECCSGICDAFQGIVTSHTAPYTIDLITYRCR